MFRVVLKGLACLLFLLLISPVAHAAEPESSPSTKAKPTKASASKKAKKRRTPARNQAKTTRARGTRAAGSTTAQYRSSGYRVRNAAYHPSSAGDLAGLRRTPDPLELKSNVALVMDQASSKVLFEKNSHVALPIASITKLMTGMVVVEAKQDMDEMLQITEADIDREKRTGSRLPIGARISRADLLHLALMSSENRAASALGRNYPGGLPAFVAAMNDKARALGMKDTLYVDSSGLSSRNVASANDLAKLVVAASSHPVLREYSTNPGYAVEAGGRHLQFANTNRLVKSPEWDIGLQKTGYISEAGQCLVMQTRIHDRPIVMIFLDAKGKFSRLADAARVRKWLTGGAPQV